MKYKSVSFLVPAGQWVTRQISLTEEGKPVILRSISFRYGNPYRLTINDALIAEIPVTFDAQLVPSYWINELVEPDASVQIEVYNPGTTAITHYSLYAYEPVEQTK